MTHENSMGRIEMTERIDIGDNTFWLWFWVTAFVCVAVVLTTLIIAYNYKQVRMAELGYSEVTDKGTCSVLWQKTDEPAKK